jgi:serine protease Do
MTAKIILPRLRKSFAAATAALLVGTIAMPHVVAPAMAQDAQAKPLMQPQGPASVADLAEGLLGAVVNVSTSQTVKGGEGPGAVPMPQLPEGSPFQDFFDDFFKNRQGKGGEGGEGGGGGGGPQKVQSLGSGFVVDAEKGIIVTNNHVIADADEIEVNFSDGSKLKATLAGTDTKTDIAVLKVDPKGKKLTAVKFGDSNKMRIGDWVMAVGNPFGLGGTVTVGIVSARNRDINSGPYDDFIQTDAAINRGNSGGPLFNMEGEVVGINTAIISPSGGSIGIGFSIPSELAAGVVEQLSEFGETRRGWLGVRIQPVTDEIAESLGMKGAKGALVAGVIKGGPVDNGTIQPGDVITKFDGKDVHEMRDLPRVVAESPVGKAVDVLLVRKGTEQTVKVTLGRLEDGEKLAKGDEAKQTQDKAKVAVTASVLGMTVGDLDEGARSKFGIGTEVSGVLITEVTPNSPAAERGIAAGEVITEIAQESVASPKEVTDKIAALKEQGRKNALLMLASKSGELRFVTVRID